MTQYQELELVSCKDTAQHCTEQQMRATLDAKQQQAAAAPPPPLLQIRPTDFLTFVVGREDDALVGFAGFPRWSSSTWPEVGHEMTPQLDTVARSLISESPLTPPPPSPFLGPAAIAAVPS